MKGVSSVSRFIFLHVRVELFQNHLFKRLSFLHCAAFAPFVRDQLTIFTWVYFGSLFCSTDLCLFFHQYHTVFSTGTL